VLDDPTVVLVFGTKIALMQAAVVKSSVTMHNMFGEPYILNE
jgi:hypothetical protein